MTKPLRHAELMARMRTQMALKKSVRLAAEVGYWLMEDSSRQHLGGDVRKAFLRTSHTQTLHSLQ
jgi:hypothetical protein